MGFHKSDAGKQDAILNFFLIFGVSLAMELVRTKPDLPCFSDVIFSILESIITTGIFYGYNKHRKEKS